MSNILRFAVFVAVFGYISAPASERKMNSGPVKNRSIQREEFGTLSLERDADEMVQAIADKVKDQLIKQLGTGKVTLNKAITYRRMSVDMPRDPHSGRGMTGGMAYYIKVEISPGKYVHESILEGDGKTTLNRMEQSHTQDDKITEF